MKIEKVQGRLKQIVFLGYAQAFRDVIFISSHLGPKKTIKQIERCLKDEDLLRSLFAVGYEQELEEKDE